jgi:hypothetical protein
MRRPPSSRFSTDDFDIHFIYIGSKYSASRHKLPNAFMDLDYILLTALCIVSVNCELLNVLFVYLYMCVYLHFKFKF